MNTQYEATKTVSAICDPDFGILSLRYRRNKDGTIIRYRNFELHSATLHKRLKTFARRLRIAGIREAQHDLITMLEAQIYNVLFLWDRVIAKAQDDSMWDRPDSRAGAFIKSRLDLVLHLALDTLYAMDEKYSNYLPRYETLFTDKISPCQCPFCARNADAVKLVQENAVTNCNELSISEFREVFSDIDWSDVPQILV